MSPLSRALLIAASTLPLLVWTAPADASGQLPQLKQCYDIDVESPTTGLHPGATVCRPFAG